MAGTPIPQCKPPFRQRVPRFDLEPRLLLFSTAIIRITDAMPATRAANHVAGQLLRSGTAALPSHGEAEAAESRADFLHKMSLCLKELRETRRWLRLVQSADLCPCPPDNLAIDSILDESDQLIRIFSASIRTARNNRT